MSYDYIDTPRDAYWRDPPDGWSAFYAAQAVALRRGHSVDWNGAQYVYWRPPWSYRFANTLAGLGLAGTAQQSRLELAA